MCLKARRACLCRYVRPFESAVKFVFLMHRKEHRDRAGTGTGRLAHQCLLGSSLFVGLCFEDDPSFQQLFRNPIYAPYILYPGAEAYDVSKPGDAALVRAETLDLQKIPLVFVLDGSWSCARKIIKQNPSLAAVKCISFTTQRVSAYRFKAQPRVECLSTIEAVHELLCFLENAGVTEPRLPGTHHHLTEIFKKLVVFQDSFSRQAVDKNAKSQNNLSTKNESILSALNEDN